MFSDADANTLQLLFKPFLLAVAAGILFAPVVEFDRSRLGYLKRLAKHSAYCIVISVSIILLGFISGYITGASRVSAVSGLVPAVLTLIGGLSIYFSKEFSRRSQIIVACMICGFSISIFYGIEVGAFGRQYDLVSRYKTLSEQEEQIRLLRKNKGLPEDPPSWITGISKD